MQIAFIIASIAATSEGGGGDPLAPLGINALAFLSQLLSFIFVLFILGRFALPAIVKTLDRRQALIRKGLEDAEKARQSLEEATSRAEEILAKAGREAQDRIERARKNAEQVARQIEDEARARAEQVKQQQIAAIRQEAARARLDLSREVVSIAINAAGKVISRSVDSNDNRRLVEEFVTTSDSARNN